MAAQLCFRLTVLRFAAGLSHRKTRMLLILLVIATCAVAFTNGANANFKGVASLYGSGTASFRTTILWGTAATLAGAITALFAARALLAAFGGKGLVPDALAQSPGFLLSVAVGGAATSFLATRFSFPVSTTHALVGGLVGAGLAGGDHTVHFAPLLRTFVWPLLASPLLAVAAGLLVHFILKAVKLLPDHRTRTLDVLHFLSGGAASFARGLNDTPKIAALLAGASVMEARWTILIVAVAMALGGLLDARNVAETLGRKITAMNPGEGFAANVATAMLVGTANLNSLPVSTTHVSVGSLVGIGVTTGKAHWKAIGSIALSWLITLPCGAAISAFTLAVLRGIGV